MLEMQRSFSGAPSTLNREARTVEAVALSGLAPTVRPAPAPDGSRTRWIEELDAEGADLSRLSGGPVLLDHSNKVDSAVGVVASVRREGDKLIATVRFDNSPKADEVIGKIEAGSVRSVSLGYRLNKMTKAGTRDGLPVFRAVDWAAHEISFTPLPVDPGATVRSQEDCKMSAENVAANGETVVVADGGGIQNRAAHNAELRSIGKAANLAQTVIDGWIDSEVSADEARRQALEALKQRSAINVNTTVVQVGYSADDPAAMTRAMSDALACRLNPTVKVEGRATEYVGMDLLSMAGELAAVRGEKLSRNRTVAADQVFTRAHSTSDFPLLLENAVNKSMLPGYQAASPTYRSWSAQRSFNDFRPHKFLRIGDFPSLSEIGAEGGEPKFGTVSENREQVTAKEYGTGISINRRALINDDLGALQNFTGMIGVRVASDENAMMYSLLSSNPTLADSTALFHADHGGNLATILGQPDVNKIADAVLAMREQTSLDGIKLNIAPKYLVIGPEQELPARQLLASIIANQTSNVNPWSGMLELVIDTNIVSNAWYIFADPAMYPCFVYGYVACTSSPVVRTEIDFETRAFKIAVGLDFGYGAIDYRGAYKNAGA